MTLTEAARDIAPAPAASPLLRTRPGLHCAPVPGGVYFGGTRGQFVLRGSDVLYAVAEGCMPLLETGTTEDALVTEFGTERARPAVRYLVAQLRENGLLLDPAAFTAPEPSAELRARHPETLARLAAHLDDPYAAFERLRRTRVELRGPATATEPARRGLLRAGLTRTTPPPPPVPSVPVCDPAMYADPALMPVGAPTVERGVDRSAAGGPAVERGTPRSAVGRTVVEHIATRSPVGAPAGERGTTQSPGDGAVVELFGAQSPTGVPVAERGVGQSPVGVPVGEYGVGQSPVGVPVGEYGVGQSPVGAPAVDGDPGASPVRGTGGDPRVVVEFLGDDEVWAEQEETMRVPVLLGSRVVLVGPVGATPDAWVVFRDRALAWAAAEGVGPAAGPVAHSLAGALAAQLLADTLTGVAEPGEAHVVHGPDLTTDRVTVTGDPVTEAVTVRLDDAPAEPLPDPQDALASAGAVATRWTGLFSVAQGERLPQMPLALRAVEHRADRTGTLTAWAGHQETATIAAALDALRTRAHEPSGTPAAGLTREHWLLDGALRHLAENHGTWHTEPAVGPAPHAEAERILDALRSRLAPAEPALTLARPDGVDWLLAEVTVDGRPLGAGWGPTAADATYSAVCTALAGAQTDATVTPLSTDALLTTDATTRTALRKQLTALAAYRGHAHRTDPVLNTVPFWYGPVTALPAQEPADADD
ncbi:hypothetical protein [Streptomyces sp. AC627_RSS907]|uniref:hypothetical protein n=1 Tax=Streptomyces sp. AC627_RSS907 TaxID=2823684 RepID=UPI001C250A2C|nr:hypothetical protein [Streptomyces sp. AC627_RSS907]